MTTSPIHKVIAEARRARFDYDIEEVMEAGIVLLGTEVKSLRLGKTSMEDGYAALEHGQLMLWNLSITPYHQAEARFNHETKRPRRLLMHRQEIRKITGKIKQRGYTLVPLRLYFTTKGLVKIELALARGRKTYDKRHAIKEREWERDKLKVAKTQQRQAFSSD
jgi:SsrA-binding protein